MLQVSEHWFGCLDTSAGIWMYHLWPISSNSWIYHRNIGHHGKTVDNLAKELKIVSCITQVSVIVAFQVLVNK